MAEEKKKEEIKSHKELTGYVTAVGTQVGKGYSTMYIEINNQRINFDKDRKVTVKVE